MPDAAAAAATTSVRLSSFQGPAKDCCAPLACCCISADGDTLCCCVRTQSDYTLPLCLHMCLCPQQGCDPIPTGRSRDKPQTACKQNVAANLCCMCVQNGGEIFFYACCWRWACHPMRKGCGDSLIMYNPCCWAVLPLIVEGR